MRKKRESIFPLIKKACKDKGMSLSRVLTLNGRSDGNSSAWRDGGFPRVDVMMDISETLDISIDELCYGVEKAKAIYIDDNQREWLSIIARIPMDRQKLCKDFLRTHAVIPDTYVEGEKIS